MKNKIPVIKTREEAESLMNQLAVTANNLQAVTAQRDMLVLSTQQDFELKIEECEKQIKAMGKALHAWADANPGEFQSSKSLEFAAGIIGFRTCPPAVALLNKQWNWEKVLAAAQTLFPKFIRKKPEIDKEAILKSRDNAATLAKLPEIGVKITQGEQFFAEPKVTTVKTRQTEKA